MNLFKRRSLTNAAVSLLLVFGIFVVTQIIPRSSVSAQSITGINAEISSLRQRINRLESQVNRLSQSTRPIPLPNKAQPMPRTGNPPMVDGEVIGPSDPLYERLATLLIELKEDVRNLDRRLAEVEQRVAE